MKILCMRKGRGQNRHSVQRDRDLLARLLCFASNKTNCLTIGVNTVRRK